MDFILLNMATMILLKFPGDRTLRFRLYTEEAPHTCEAFCKALPFGLRLLHARTSGMELWAPDAPRLDIIQENATTHAEPGEIGIAPDRPARNKIAGCIGLFYGEGKFLDAANIFGKVLDEDLPLFQILGEEVWMEGSRVVRFELAGADGVRGTGSDEDEI